MGAYMINPERMRELSAVAGTAASIMENEAKTTRSYIDRYELGDFDLGVAALCSETADELGLLRDLTQDRANRIENAANEGYEVTDEFELLEQSLNDDVGSTGFEGRKLVGFTVLQAERWLTQHPNFTPAELAAEMEDAAANGSTQALITLSEGLWSRVGGMKPTGAKEFLIELGDAAFMTAVELTTPPATSTVANQLVLMTVPRAQIRPDDALRLYLFQREGIKVSDVASRGEAALGHLFEIARRDEDGALVTVNALFAFREENPAIGFSLADPARKIILENFNVLEVQLRDPTVGQHFIDFLALGSAGDSQEAVNVKQELDEILAGYLDWVEDNPNVGIKGPTFATLYRRLDAVGHSVGIDWVVAAKALTPLIKGKTGTIAGVLLEMSDAVVPDEVEKGLEKEGELNEKQLTVAFMILSKRDPDAAAVLAEKLAVDPDAVGQRLFTNEMFTKLSLIPNADEPSTAESRAFNDLKEIRNQLANEWD